MLAAILLSTRAVEPISTEMVLRQVFETGQQGTPFSGVMRIVRNGRVLLETSAGSDGHGGKNQPDSPLFIGNISKVFIALTTMKLADEKKIELDEVAGRYLPWLPVFAKGITVRQLLTHTSGLTTLDEGEIERASLHLKADDFKSRVMLTIGDRLYCTPGSQFRFNHLDYLILAAIAEHAGGDDIATLLRKKITEPLGMKDTKPFLGKRFPNFASWPYRIHNGKSELASDATLQFLGETGALISTTSDLTLLGKAILDGQVLSAESTHEFLYAAPKLGMAGQGSFRYNVDVFNRPTAVLDRSGFVGGTMAAMVIAPNQDLVLVMISNRVGQDIGNCFYSEGLLNTMLSISLGP